MKTLVLTLIFLTSLCNITKAHWSDTASYDYWSDYWDNYWSDYENRKISFYFYYEYDENGVDTWKMTKNYAERSATNKDDFKAIEIDDIEFKDILAKIKEKNEDDTEVFLINDLNLNQEFIKDSTEILTIPNPIKLNTSFSIKYSISFDDYSKNKETAFIHLDPEKDNKTIFTEKDYLKSKKSFMKIYINDNKLENRSCFVKIFNSVGKLVYTKKLQQGYNGIIQVNQGINKRGLYTAILFCSNQKIASFNFYVTQ